MGYATKCPECRAVITDEGLVVKPGLRPCAQCGYGIDEEPPEEPVIYNIQTKKPSLLRRLWNKLTCTVK